MNPAEKLFRIICGLLFTVNFVIFWSIPIVVQGLLWKHVLCKVLLPVYTFLDNNKYIRTFAGNYIYTNPKHADFFVSSVILLLNSSVSIGCVFYWQLKTGCLPWWLIAMYYFSWVGFGGRIMGAAYALAHKEGHNRGLYKKWIRESVGHIFENILGPMFGNVPWNFTTSHVFIHHRLDGGIGDTFYEWDLDRTNLTHFMLYIYRIAHHMCGASSLKFFGAHGHKAKKEMLRKGMIAYWSIAVAFLAITRSPSFVFWIYIQPFICMTYFLALLNYGFHGFIEFDENGINISCVNSSTIIDGDDDYFGEDDHMAHHYHPGVYYKDLAEHQKSKESEFVKYKASVFRGLSILELSLFLLFSQWDVLADHYVDFSGKLSREQIKSMLRERAMRRETTYEKYEHYLANPTPEARKALLPEIRKAESTDTTDSRK
mmetsp:Transcript_22181/g.32275  ORF Transcript_22181/g.32275 Transcript_22181/m.32275 type:complete len:429 (-) Transcript_22181:163-1449(-)|eukprot:CAMPEP_0185032176 /NCGR_PEP_ID=MMETSP1103-20130426/20078_1 /TAXON_ID=36769 /ORGANISM="Paraphysomonas bandaiensis, Strain Caron Lab Isolate" /LENGTH=428 /DNA_ID=CAMNT_0027567975 /DNA_START=55 /DNA_END=1341 /DNA_ORIENTATION=+